MSVKKVKKHYKSKIFWTEETEELLCDIWAKHIIEIRSTRKNRHAYEEMLRVLSSENFECTMTELKTKLHNLTTKYRLEKLKVKQNDGFPSEWALYPKMHRILGTKVRKAKHYRRESFDYNDDSSSTDSHSETSDDMELSGFRNPKKRKRKLAKIDLIHIEFREYFKQSVELSTKMYQEKVRQTQLMEKCHEEDVKRTKLLEQFFSDSTDLKKAFIEFLRQ